eukprot:144679-Pleurochrysis_carterae.AAC.1
MSDCLSGLRILEKVWRGRRNREKLGTVIFMWIPSHVGITPNVIADNIAGLRLGNRKQRRKGWSQG